MRFGLVVAIGFLTTSIYHSTTLLSIAYEQLLHVTNIFFYITIRKATTIIAASRRLRYLSEVSNEYF